MIVLFFGGEGGGGVYFHVSKYTGSVICCFDDWIHQIKSVKKEVKVDIV